ncbi:CocE/NonD family hydrolase [Oceanobacillus sojae]|uniref:CocE/NonD family hydrolase n=1 Tax=Oceanobacillus sojae TaxID=582851 RepID=UPI0021A4F2CC|nr:CocE/NonD family hydrolase [Oceanobacillus sojae]MCT1905429.1 CocE/NonD family hydrolase [Oceanobacillus sojae]
MATFQLYRSGIFEMTFQFDAGQVIYQEKDCTNNQWSKTFELTDEKARELEGYYHINPHFILEHLPVYNTIFHTEKKQVVTPWGDIYQKNQSDTWVQREKQFPLDIVMVDQSPVAFISTSRENCSVLVKEGYEEYTPVNLWRNGNVSAATYAVEYGGNYMVPMRDGIKLATDVWLPGENASPLPAVLVRTPYGKKLFAKSHSHFVQRGYALIIQDTRGRQDSEGEWIPMYSEMTDGDDTLNWIAEQPWCNGNIGMIGASYGGYVQWAAAASGNPNLKALVSMVTAGSPFLDIPRKGGALISGMLAWAFAMSEKEFKPENMLRSDWDDVLKIRPLQDIPKKALGKNVDFWEKWLSHPVNDAFWKIQDWHQHHANIHVPALIVSGWYDDNGMGTTEALETVADYGSHDKKILLGPWMHNANTARDLQGVPLGNNALRYDLDFYYLQWFDRKLKGIDNGVDSTAPVEYYITGENKWVSANQWPPENIQWQYAYLSSNGHANTSAGDGVLLFDKNVISGSDKYIYDPMDPAPHLIDVSENEIGVPANYKEVEKREDILVYDSEPLENPLTIAGDIRAYLYASSSAKDTDWVVRVTDVDPAGNSVKLVDSVLRARYRNGFEKEELLEPNQIEKYVIRTSKIANTFKKGHRIRLTITSSAKNFIFPNTNTGEDPATDVRVVEAIQQIYHKPGTLSYIQIPVLSEEKKDY